MFLHISSVFYTQSRYTTVVLIYNAAEQLIKYIYMYKLKTTQYAAVYEIIILALEMSQTIHENEFKKKSMYLE